MSRTHIPPDRQPNAQEDLPPGLVRLTRQIARDCAKPGTYTITLEVPQIRGRPRTAEISRVERIRILEIKHL